MIITDPDFWRHFQDAIDGGGGGGGGYPQGDEERHDPFERGDPDRGPPPPTDYNPGPPGGGGYGGGGGRGGGGGGRPAPPPDIFAGYSGPAVDTASQLARQFVAMLSYPGLDVNQLALQLLQNGLLTDANAAYEYLFYSGNGMSDDLRNAHPNAQFGLDGASFQSRRDQFGTLFTDLIARDPEYFLTTGGDALQTLYRQAFRGNWSQTEVMQHLQTDAQFAQLRADQPWIAVGQGERQAAQAFSSIYGSAPVDVDTLAAWFRFNTSVQQVSRVGREAVGVAAQLPQQTEVR